MLIPRLEMCILLYKMAKCKKLLVWKNICYALLDFSFLECAIHIPHLTSNHAFPASKYRNHCRVTEISHVNSSSHPVGVILRTWWRHQMETFSALLAICAGNSPVNGEFPAQRPVTRSFDVSFDLRLNKRFTNLTIVYSILYQRKRQSSASLAFVRGIHRRPVNSPHKWPVTRKMFPFDDVIMKCTIISAKWDHYSNHNLCI